MSNLLQLLRVSIYEFLNFFIKNTSSVTAYEAMIITRGSLFFK